MQSSDQFPQRAGTLMDQLGPSALEGALALATISDLKAQSCVNMLLAIAAIVYLSVNIVCIVLNGYDNDDPQERACTPELFHRLEFWATFCFNVVDVFALIYSPKRLSQITVAPFLLKLVIFINVAGSFTSASLVTINLEKFEIPSHELEYFNELTVSLFDLVLLFSLFRGMGGAKLRDQTGNGLLPSFIMVALAIAIAITQLSIYNFMGWVKAEDGYESNGEQLAHYFEFVFQIISASITFWFTMDNKLVADAKLQQVMASVGDGTFSSSSSCGGDSASELAGRD